MSERVSWWMSRYLQGIQRTVAERPCILTAGVSFALGDEKLLAEALKAEGLNVETKRSTHKKKPVIDLHVSKVE